MGTVLREALIVEDASAIREVLRDVLEDAGYTVHEATDGVDALAILGASPRGLLVLLDNLLPGLDGLDILAALEARGTTTGAQGLCPITQHAYVLITASPQRITPEHAARLLRLGVPVLAKPFDLADFMGAVDQAMRRLSAASLGH